jgi:hypothetical protein
VEDEMPKLSSSGSELAASGGRNSSSSAGGLFTAQTHVGLAGKVQYGWKKEIQE